MEKQNGKKAFWIYFSIIACVFILILAISYYRSLNASHGSELIDTDTFMRLVRVEQLAETGEWYDSVIHRSNYPYGDELHWTRPLDVILLTGAYILKPFLGFRQGLLSWGIVISPLLGLISLLALYWAVRPVMNKNARRLLWLLFLSQTILLQIFSFGRPDHHSLLLLLFIILIGCLCRIVQQPENNRLIILLGLTAAFSFWISVETIFAIIMVFMTLGILWLIRGEIYARQMLLFSLTLFVFSSLFLFIERPLGSLFAVEYDKISITHLFVFMLAIIAVYLLTLIKNTDLIQKLAKVFLIFLISGAAIWLVFPDFYRGPMAGVNKAIIPIWLSRVSEAQPIWSLGLYDATVIIGLITLFILYFVYQLVKGNLSKNFASLFPFIIGFAVYLPLGIYQVRFNYYLVLILIIPLAVFMEEIMIYITNLKVKEFYKPVLRVIVMLLFILGLPGTGLLASINENDNSKHVYPDLKTLSAFLNEYQQTEPQDETILTFIDFGPQILYRTNFNIIAGPYHRNDQGILYIYNVMAAEDMADAREMLAERSIDLIILCPKSSEKNFYKRTTNKNSFYEQLLSNKKPTFLKEIDLPQELAGSFSIYKVVND